MTNTQEEFYENWTAEMLKRECARLNKILKEINKDLQTAINVLEVK